MWTWFNVVYVLVLLVTLIATAELFRRKHKAPLQSAYTFVLYLVATAFLPLVLLIGYPAGGSVGMGIVALAANAFGLPAGDFFVRAIGKGALIVGIFVGSYLVGLVGVLGGAFLAQLVGKVRSRGA